MILQVGNEKFKYNINGTVLPNMSVANDSGVLIDSNLKFTNHIDAIVTKAYRHANLYSCAVLNDSFCHLR